MYRKTYGDAPDAPDDDDDDYDDDGNDILSKLD